MSDPVTVNTTVADVVGSTLADLGVGHAFGVVGSGNFRVTNALRAAGVRYVAARHEGGAATMADAYSRMSGTLAVLTTHQGCGLTNAVTGITEAAKSRTPLIVLAADTAGAAVRSNFRIDQDALARSVGAVAERVHSPASAVADITRAYRTAVNDRRTVVVSLPLDVQASHWTRRPETLRASSRQLRFGRRPPPLRSFAGCCWPPVGRCSWPAVGPGRPARRSQRSPSRSARWSRRRRWPTACSRVTRTPWVSRAGSPHRWPPS